MVFLSIDTVEITVCYATKNNLIESNEPTLILLLLFSLTDLLSLAY
jgi:hypothetical protein